MIEDPDREPPEPPEPEPHEPIEEVDALPGGVEFEEVDAVPVFERHDTIEPRRPALLPVPMQAAAVAVTGFLAGLLTIVLFRRRHARRGGRQLSRRGEGKRPDPRGNVVASRSFLVDVHLLGGRD